ncbi:hypothetical protein RI367_002573 [Sorochytrium milnesiophthora]
MAASFWKSAGLSYLQYINIAARAARNSLKADAKVLAQRREEQTLRFAKWENGKPTESKYVIPPLNE